MHNPRLVPILLMLVLGLLMVSCGEGAAEETTVSTTVAATSTSAVATTAGPTTAAPTPTLPPPVPPNQPLDLLEFVRTVQVTPDANYLTGAFSRINYLPATDRFVVTFGGELAEAPGPMGKGFSYKEYTVDMQETGVHGVFSEDLSDAGSVMVDNTYYSAAMASQGDVVGWHLLKIDTMTWETLVDTFYPLDYPQEGDSDPMVAFVNGQIDISSAWSASGDPPNPDTLEGEYGTHHHFFNSDLEFLEKRILTSPPHVNGSYMVFVDGIYYLVTASTYTEDVILAKYDAEWNYLGGRTLVEQAHFSTGLEFDGERFYVAYTDTSQRTVPGPMPFALNIRLAAFDREWNLLQDVAVTDFTWDDLRQPGRPWVIRHGDRLYVSYDVDSIVDSVTREEALQWQAYVSVYRLTQP